MDPREISAIACGLILAGLAAENFHAHRWVRAEGPARFNPLAALALGLPVLGLGVLAFLTI
jgi:hypothetical protein